MSRANDQQAPNVYVLVAADDQGVATQVEATLRNAGWSARTAWARDLEDVDEVLSRTEPDMLLCAADLDVAAIADLARQFSPELPVIAIAPSVEARSAEQLAAVMQAGAADLVSLDSEAARSHFEAVCLREHRGSVTSWTLRQARMRIAEFQSRQRLLMAETTRALITISEGIIIEANPAAADALGAASAEDLIAQPLLDRVVPADRDLLREHLTQIAKRRISDAELECRWQAGDQREAPMQVRLSSRDVDDEQYVDLILQPLASASGAAPAEPLDLTGSRAAAAQAIAKAACNTETHGVMYFVIDGFESLEQRLGIVQAARVADTWQALLVDQLSARSEIFRLCAHECVALIPAPSTDALEALAGKLCREIAQQTFQTDKNDCHLTVSIALFPITGSGAKAEEVLRDCCLEARSLSRSSGNSFCSIGDAAKAAAQERQERATAESLRQALKRKDGLRLAYQRISNLGEDQRDMFDVLVRMVDASGSELPARDFLPIAERFGLMPAVDCWVFSRAIQTLEKRGDPNTALLLRLSEASLLEPDALLRQLREHPPPEHVIAAQIREGHLQHQIRKATTLREGLAELGIDFVVDYFGDGQSAPSLLEKLRPDYVKFAPHFARDFSDETVHKRLLALIKAARNTGARIIIPFVENTRVMGELWQIGINYVQGNGLHEPEAVMLADQRRAV